MKKTKLKTGALPKVTYQSNNEYLELLAKLKERIRNAQYNALRLINIELIELYWHIGKEILAKQKALGWGKTIVQQLSQDLLQDHPGSSGFSAANLWRMRAFYDHYHSNTKLAPLVREISWSKNIVILEKCKDDLEREFYIKATSKFGWTKKVLINQIENNTYYKTLINQNNFDKNLPSNVRDKAKLAIKDEYLFDFLELSEKHHEAELENAILSNIEKFLSALGDMFSFVSRQYHIEVANRDYYIDLLLYHRALQSLVAIDLKIGEFKPEYVGKMQFYLAALDKHVRLQNENASIGIILCKTKDKTIVEYTLHESNKPMGVGTYKIVSQLPDDLAKYLPTPEQITALLQEWN